MPTITLLRIVASHRFDDIVHISAHPSRAAAERHAIIALFSAREAEEPQWQFGFRETFEEVEFFE
jgi:hypothetical protein